VQNSAAMSALVRDVVDFATVALSEKTALGTERHGTRPCGSRFGAGTRVPQAALGSQAMVTNSAKYVCI